VSRSARIQTGSRAGFKPRRFNLTTPDPWLPRMRGLPITRRYRYTEASYSCGIRSVNNWRIWAVGLWQRGNPLDIPGPPAITRRHEDVRLHGSQVRTVTKGRTPLSTCTRDHPAFGSCTAVAGYRRAERDPVGKWSGSGPAESSVRAPPDLVLPFGCRKSPTNGSGNAYHADLVVAPGCWRARHGEGRSTVGCGQYSGGCVAICRNDEHTVHHVRTGEAAGRRRGQT
jgi:hypothetical protein